MCSTESQFNVYWTEEKKKVPVINPTQDLGKKFFHLRQRLSLWWNWNLLSSARWRWISWRISVSNLQISIDISFFPRITQFTYVRCWRRPYTYITCDDSHGRSSFLSFSLQCLSFFFVWANFITFCYCCCYAIYSITALSYYIQAFITITMVPEQ